MIYEFHFRESLIIINEFNVLLQKIVKTAFADLELKQKIGGKQLNWNILFAKILNILLALKIIRFKKFIFAVQSGNFAQISFIFENFS